MVLSCRTLLSCGAVVFPAWWFCEIDAVTRCGDIFTVALGAATGPGEPPPIAKYELTILTARRLQDEAAGLVMADGFDNVFEMILNLPLGNAEHLGQLVRGQTRADQQFDHALARRASGSKHRVC